MGATIDRSVNSGGGPNVFKICGAVCPRIGSLLPEEGETPKYAELYIYHGGDEADNRIQALNKDDKAEGGLDKDIVKGLEIMLNTHNSLVKQFRMAKQVLAENEFADVSIRIVAPGELDGPQFNLPSTDELACLVFGEVTLEAPKRDIIIRCRGSGLQRISSLHPAYMSLQYPLLFPYVLHTVEFQKRGLPHAHILVWQDKEKRGEVTPALIDSFVSAEIPDPVEDPLGYALVAEFMMHGPCGEHNPKCPCMKDGAHLNVEWCNKTHVIKYLYKYVTKGPDFSKTLFERIKNTGDPEDDDIDEIEEYRTCRYICANDSFWRCYGFDIHSKHPSVERLVVHLLGKHVVRFRALANLPALVNNSLLQKTMVTEWFVANARHASARSLTYYDFPTRWSWVAESKKWVRRKRSDKIGRVYYVHPSTGELYYLRMLLMLVKGAKCYADVRTYNGTVYGSFKDACTARGLLGDDTEWYYAFDEALEWGIGNQLRQLFVTMILYCGVLDENVFFEKYWTYLAEDIQYRIRSSLHDASYTVPVDELRNMLLDELAVVFAKNGSSISNHALPLKTIYANDSIVNNMVSDELSQDCETLIKTAETMQQQLNEDQKVAFKTIVGKVRDGKPGLFFVSGQGGTGKTFLWNAMVAYLRGYKRIVLTVASSGVASLLLPGGRTAHSRFKIPIDLENDGVCDIRRGTMLCSLIEAASLIIWDEALMTHRKCFEALDRSLRDVLSADDPLLAELPFGGKVVVLGGDLRQILPVIEGGTRSQVVDAAITNSPLWGHIIVLPLTINQRLAVQTANAVVQAEVAAFAEWVLNIGDGTIPAVARQGESSPTWITIPDEYLVHTEGDKIAAIVESVYIDLLTRGNELRLVLWGERALEFDAEAVRAMGVNEPVIAIFVGTLPKMSHGVKSLSGGSACRWYIDEDIPDINLFRERSSTPKRGARRSLFTSPSKDKSQLGEDDPLAADGDLLLGEETITEPLVETASANAIAVDSDKANQTVIPKTKRNASSTKSDVTSEELLGPLSAAMLRHTIDESCFGPVTYSSDEAHFPAPHLVKISCKMMFGVMLADLGLPNARYSSYVHEDGEVSSVVTFYSPSRFVGEGLEQFKIGGSLAATSEIVEDSAAREGIRHIEESEDVKIEDLHYAELTSVMKSYKKLLWKSMKKRKESENFEKQLSASIKRMAGSSRNIVSLISDRRSVGQGSEAVYYNETLARIEAVANELSEVAKEIKKEAKEA
ncbi:hypothetical protein ACQ4PT_063881 [Festuca glaucescens]